MVSKTGAFFGSTLAANYSWIGKRILVVVIVTPVGSNMRVFFFVRFLANSFTALPICNAYRFSVCASSGQSQGHPEPVALLAVLSLRNLRPSAGSMVLLLAGFLLLQESKRWTP